MYIVNQLSCKYFVSSQIFCLSTSATSPSTTPDTDATNCATETSPIKDVQEALILTTTDAVHVVYWFFFQWMASISTSFASESLMDPRIQVKLDKYQKCNISIFGDIGSLAKKPKKIRKSLHFV